MKQLVCYCVLLIILNACTPDIDIKCQWEKTSPLEAEYSGVVIPPNIAPLNFFLKAEDYEAVVLTHGSMKVTAFKEKGTCIPEMNAWKSLLAAAQGEDITVQHCVQTENGWAAYSEFTISVACDSIDPYLAYRLIPPGYEGWNEMGIYQRNLETFEEKAIITNRQTNHNCMNCHSFCMQDPSKMLLHMREKHAGTLLTEAENIIKLDTKTEQTLSALVYPHWHPNGKFIACSVNDIKQLFHTHHPNRIEVMDWDSYVVVYDIENNELLTTLSLSNKENMETFPAFSPDGKKLYFCTSRKRTMPDDYDKVRYHLCCIDFNAEHRAFGKQVDTLYQADIHRKSVSFPRVSPNGRFLLMTLSDYGNFSIWHQEADLWMIDLQKKELKKMEKWNSQSVESYHSWSSNSHWVVFSSRREDGLYTRPYIAYIDRNGNIYKPFVLPQREGNFYQRSMYSYNIPELLKGEVKTDNRLLVRKVLNDETLKVKGFISK